MTYKNSSPVLIRGVEYPSQAEAARQLGVTPDTIRSALDKGTLKKVGLKKLHERVVLNGISYRSVHAAAAATGISRYALAYWKDKAKYFGVRRVEKETWTMEW